MIRGTQSLNSLFNATGVGLYLSGLNIPSRKSKQIDLSGLNTPILVRTPTENPSTSNNPTVDEKPPVILDVIDVSDVQPIPKRAFTEGEGSGSTAESTGKGSGVSEKPSIFTPKNIAISILVIIALVVAYKYFKRK